MEVSRATYAPVRFDSEAFLRIGSLTNKLKDYPAKEALVLPKPRGRFDITKFATATQRTHRTSIPL